MKSILWQWVDRPGHEAARITARLLAGTSVFAHDANPVSLDYEIAFDAEWRTTEARVRGWVGERRIDVDIRVDGATWTMNGAEVDAVRECVDIDLNFSPVTNLLPICRLDLKAGDAQLVTAAWLRFPSFALEPLAQRYTRVDETHVLYQSLASGFEALLTVDESGLVTDYPGVWFRV
ncbi:MAG: hypothetical protein DMF56_10540 [Acidobacteria bacterium]|nr:MAG: hypothetical protein DMF56_10540 [Acidobacteriota bacterium]